MITTRRGLIQGLGTGAAVLKATMMLSGVAKVTALKRDNIRLS